MRDRDCILGKTSRGMMCTFPLTFCPSTALLAGVPGSGKTYTMLYLASQLAGQKNRRPILVLEPAKQEYRRWP